MAKILLEHRRRGRTVAILGDTRKTAGIDKLALNADVLVHESTFGKGRGKNLRAIITIQHVFKQPRLLSGITLRSYY